MIESWLSIPVPVPAARWRLVCFPHAGGGASSFVPWARALAPVGVEVVAVRLPGREGRLREAVVDDLTDLVTRLDHVLPQDQDRPTAWLGHSSGARVAFEVARCRHRLGRSLPARLFVSGAPAPDVRRSTPTLHTIPGDDAFLAAVAQAYGGVPESVLEHPELSALVAPALRADLKVHERYVYTEAPPLPIPFTVFGGLSDGSVSEDWLRQWSRHTRAGASVTMFPGGHFFVYDEQVRADVIRAVADVLT